MRHLIFDLELLRSFVTGIELGSFAKAAERLGRSSAAVSTHLKKLEEEVGTPILQKSGRGLVLTPTGEILLGYARRLLELNDEAATAIRGVDLEGSVRIGLQEDFGEFLFAKMLGDFARTHPRVRVEAHVVRNAELLEFVNLGRLDLALAWDAKKNMPHAEFLGDLPMCWVGAKENKIDLPHGVPLPLVVFESPCLMRSAATTALDRANISWRIAFTSISLSGIWAAVSAGLGITVRTPAGLPDYLQVRDDLPELPTIGLVLYRAQSEQSEIVRSLSDIIRYTLHDLLPMPTK